MLVVFGVGLIWVVSYIKWGDCVILIVVFDVVLFECDKIGFEFVVLVVVVCKVVE